MNKIILTIGLSALLAGCSNKDNTVPSQAEMDAARANLAFTCTHEADRLPPLDSQADELFRYGLHLEKLDGPKDFNAAARYYRIAAAYGHYKANHNLQRLVSQGFADSPHPDKETIDLVEQLIQAGVPGGYYDMGHYLELGYGVKQDDLAAKRYFRKAADLGSPEAQAYLGKLLAPWTMAPDIARQMRRCAADQGQGEAATDLGINLKNSKLYADAVQAYQKGVKAGDTLSALALENGFEGPPETDELDYLGVPKDPERARRYNLIRKFIRENEGRNPKVPDIDKIVPLPPAKLPPWDGTFQWQKEQDAAKPPAKPADELIAQLAKAKNLDPATGLPVAGAARHTSQSSESAKAARVPLGTTATAGARCQETGTWCAQLRPGLVAQTEKYFRVGQTFPLLDVYEPRAFAWLDSLLGKRRYTTDVVWKLVSYEDKA